MAAIRVVVQFRHSRWYQRTVQGRGQLKCDGTRAETRIRLSAKRTSPFKSAGASVQSTTGSRGVRISGSNAGYTMFRGSVKVLATHSIRQFPLYFPSRASPCAITFQLESTTNPVQAWTVCAGCRRLRIPDFITTVHEVGKVFSPTYRPPFPGTHLLLETESTRGSQCGRKDYVNGKLL